MTGIETTKALYELFARGQIEDAVERFVDVDAVVENPLPDPIPFGGRFEGREGFAAYLKGILSGIKIEQFKIDEIFGEADRVVVLGRETSRVLSTGKHYAMSWVHVLTVRNGRVQHMREYNDTAAMAAAFTPSRPRKPTKLI